MTTLEIVLLVLVAVLALVAWGGTIAARRRTDARASMLRERVAQANEALAQAHAEDNGWDRSVLEAAAREAAGGPVEELHLIAVDDRPGTDDDEALFRIVAGGQERDVRLRRSGGAWVAA